MTNNGGRPLQFLRERRDQIQEDWAAAQQEASGIRPSGLNPEEARRQSDVVLTTLMDAIEQAGLDNPDHSAFERLHQILSEASLRRERGGSSASATAEWIFMLRDLWILPMLAEESSSEEVRREAQRASRLVDHLALRTYQSRMERREDVIRQQADELLEISTPVIKVWDGVVAAPLIGALDSERTQRFMERLLHQIAEDSALVALVDITGVPTIDTQTAQHLIDTVSAVRLVGSRVILTGVRPSIAQTLVHLGIPMSDITTRASFAGGLRVAMDMLALEVTAAPGSQS